MIELIECCIFPQTLFPVYLSHTPAGAATYQLVHYVQEARSGRFSKFDWGSPEENMAKHGNETPPDYNLKNVLARVILHYSDNDWLSSPIDVKRLYGELPNVEKNHIPDERFERKYFTGTCHLILIPFAFRETK